jgi:hypothetical protein
VYANIYLELEVDFALGSAEIGVKSSYKVVSLPCFFEGVHSQFRSRSAKRSPREAVLLLAIVLP